MNKKFIFSGILFAFLSSAFFTTEAQTLESDSSALVALYNVTNGDNWNNNTNWLVGDVPDWFGITVEAGRVVEVRLPNNNLTAFFAETLPDELGTLSELRVFDLSQGRFNGTALPESIFDLPNLEEFKIAAAFMDGQVPADFGSASLLNLDISFNRFTGSAAFLSNLPLNSSDAFISVQGNKFEGSLAFLADFPALMAEIWLSDNLFSELPDLTGLTSISNLQVENNNLDFGDFEPNASILNDAVGFSIEYVFQNNITADSTILFNDGQEVTLSIPELAGSGSFARWFKNEEISSDFEVGIGTIYSPTSTFPEGGLFYVSVRNNLVPDLTLISGLYYVEPNPFNTSYEFIDPIISFENLKDVSNEDEDFNMSENLGDINDDGIEDFGILFRQKLLIFYGGEISEIPDLEISSANDFEMYELRSADFNGDGHSDFAVSLDNFSDTDRSNKIDIYFGGPALDGTSDQTISLDDLDGITPGFFTFNVIGDINNDDAADILVSHRGQSPLNIFIGGTIISSTPSSSLSDFDFPGIDLGTPLLGGTKNLNLGDINNDGFDDFAVSDYSRTISDGEGFSTGLIYIYFGNETATFTKPEKLLSAPLTPQSDYRFFGSGIVSGDFNADNINDIAVIPSRANDPFIDSKGSESLFIYHGSNDFDTIPDYSLRLPGEPFELDDELILKTIPGNITSVPDLDNNGTDELIFGSFNGTNAILLSGSESFLEEGFPSLVLRAPDQTSRLNTENNSTVYQRNSAVGDFNNDGALEIILAQDFREDDSDPVYIYALNNTAPEIENQVFVVLENAAPNTLIGTIEAADPQGSALTFTITSGNENAIFSLNSSSGELSLAEGASLDISTTSSYTLEVSVLDNGGLSASTEIVVNVDDALSANNPADLIIVYPNPGSSVRINAPSDNYSLQITDLKGRVILSEDFSGGQHSLDLQGFEQGVYIVKLESGSLQVSRRIIKD